MHLQKKHRATHLERGQKKHREIQCGVLMSKVNGVSHMVETRKWRSDINPVTSFICAVEQEQSFSDSSEVTYQ